MNASSYARFAQTLLTLIRQHPDRSQERVLLNNMRPRSEDQRSMPSELNIFQGRRCESSNLNAPAFLLQLWFITFLPISSHWEYRAGASRQTSEEERTISECSDRQQEIESSTYDLTVGFVILNSISVVGGELGNRRWRRTTLGKFELRKVCPGSRFCGLTRKKDSARYCLAVGT